MGLLNGAKDKNLQPPRAKTKAFNLFKSKNKNLQPSKEKKKLLTFLRARTRTFNLQNKKQKPSISKLFK
jgi:hypothetical protein